MIEYVKGDIFESGTQAIVNPVNCVGVMGKGLALEFKKRYPLNYIMYKKSANIGKIKIGQIFTTVSGQTIILNFPTKKHWKDKSDYNYIKYGMIDLINVIKSLKIKSIAIPALGCGNGGLEWERVKKIIEEPLKELDIVVKIYEPKR